MKRVFRLQGKGKLKDGGLRGLAMHPEIEDVNTTVTLIQALIPLGLRAVGEALAAEVTRLVGPRYSRTGGIPGHVRWCHQQGSVYLADQKLPITYQRVRDRLRKTEVPLTTYQQLQLPRQADAGLFRKVLLGLSCRNYEVCAETVPEAFGLSPSSVSRRFIRASARQLQALQERRLEPYDVVALLLDGKTFVEDSMVIALGITLTGEKVILGFVQTATENETVCAAFLQELVERGLRVEQGLLCIIDGAKGLRKAIQTVFGDHGIVQRCQWHKRENVLAYLPKGQRASVRRKLQAAYAQPTSEAATRALGRLRQELRLMNESAVKSLDEGLDETLTLHRLGLFPQLGVSLKTTNCLESLHALLGQRTDKVDRWRSSDQKQRWLAAALLDIEPRLRRIKGFRALPLLRTALHAELSGKVNLAKFHVA
ncbi:MAG: transposase [candidate division NC10 bacterium]|nr:transposase [candidate division NC10 bacterium]MDE2485677.1 transposase [candidate division NC10 bacterium]